MSKMTRQQMAAVAMNLMHELGVTSLRWGDMAALAQAPATPAGPVMPTRGKYQMCDLQPCPCGAPLGVACKKPTCMALQPVLEANIKLQCEMCGASRGTVCTKEGCTNLRVWEGELKLEEPPTREVL